MEVVKNELNGENKKLLLHFSCNENDFISLLQRVKSHI